MTSHAGTVAHPKPRPDLRLILITDAELARPRSVLEVVEAALAAGAPAVQLRMKGAAANELFHQGQALREPTRDAGALLFINDRLDVALAVHADGVHLGPSDLPVAAARQAARAAQRPDLIIGASTDDPMRARQLAGAGADYIGCGAIFGTRSKSEVGDERIGTDRLRQVVQAVPCPVVGIGGITPDNVAEVAAAGAAGAAVISAVMCAPDPAAATRELLAAFRS